MRSVLRIGLVLAVFGPSCSGTKKPNGDGADSDSDIDTDSDTDTGTGTGTETDTDTGTGTGRDDGGPDADSDTDTDECGECGVGKQCCDDPWGKGGGGGGGEDGGAGGGFGPGCTDIFNDPFNCGGCDNVCGPLTECQDGGCRCWADLCGGDCTDFMSDPDHCGDCDTVCPDDARFCDLGACRSCEDMGRTTCAGECLDTRTDELNCGGCGVLCAEGEVCSGGSCIEGTCEDLCWEEEVCCESPFGGGGGVADGGVAGTDGTDWEGRASGCTDPNQDAYNCGGCDIVCEALEWCDRGACDCSTEPAGGGDADVDSDADFGIGGGLDPIQDCGGTCVNIDRDPDHCGGCDLTCLEPEPYCYTGTCRSCASLGRDDCGGECVNLDFDAGHCGGCATPCAADEGCVFGACIPGDSDLCGACPDGWVCCENEWGEGDCASLRTEDRHCGGCGVVCGAGEICEDALCVPDAFG